MSEKQLSAGGNSRPFRLEYRFKNDPVAERIFELVVTTRTPAYNTHIPYAEQPTLDEMSVIVARTMTNWKNVMQSIIFGMELPEKRLAGIKAIRNSDDIEESLRGIPESDALPYVTVWNMTNYYHPGLSITVHSYDDGSEALAIAKAHIAGIELFEQHCEKMGFYIINKLTVETNPPTLSDTNRIGRNAESLPDTQQRKTTQQIEGAYFHAVNAVVRNTKKGKFQGSISLESFEGNKQNFKTQAQIADKPLDYKAVQYEHDTLVAYPITGFASVGEWNGKRYLDIPVGDKNYRVFREERGTREFPTDWEKVCIKLAIADESMKVGMKIEIPADYLVLKTDSKKDDVQRLDKDNNPVQYKNLYGFYRKEDSVKTQVKPKVANTGLPAHHDLDEYFGDGNTDYANAMYDEIHRKDDIPF